MQSIAMRNFWRPVLTSVAMATLVWSAGVGPAGAAGSGHVAAPDLSVPGQVILKLNRASDLTAVATDYQLDPLPLDSLATAPLYLMRVPDGLSSEGRATALSTDPRVAYAEANTVGGAPEDQASSWASGGSAGGYLAQWAPTTMHLSDAFGVTRGAGVTVAVLDTGIDATHPGLSDHLVAGYDFVDNDADPTEVGSAGVNMAYGHGTFVAGLVALAAPDAKIMPVRVLDQNGQGDVWRLAKAMVWAAGAGANVINLSLGTSTRTHLTNDLIGSLASNGRGVVVVAAAGNNASTIPQFPAAEGGSRVLSVGASTPTDTLAAWSDFGSWVRVAAPGVSLLSTVPGGQYATWSGTSMATGLASGEAALVRAAYPGLNPQAVISRIANTASRIGGPVSLRINAGAAVGR